MSATSGLSRVAIGATCAALIGCAVSLEDEMTPKPAASAPLPVAAGCAPQRATLRGALRSVPVDGDLLWFTPGAAGTTAERFDAATCLDGWSDRRWLSDVTPLSAVPLGNGEVAGFFVKTVADPSAPFGVREEGVGVAVGPLDGIAAGDALMWTADRPRYGTAAVVDGDYLFAYGCVAARFLDGDCFVARQPLTAIGDESQVEYYRGGGNWTPREKESWPIVDGASDVSVEYDARRGRFLMLYAGVLGDRILVRSGIQPWGPWSAPHEVALCQLPEGAFCAEVQLHVAASGRLPVHELVVSYAVATLEPHDDSDSYATRLATVSLPPLP